MTLEEFRAADIEGRRRSPALFRLTSADPPASDHDLGRVEKLLNVSLPKCFKEFLKNFGGGNFGLVTTFSASERSEWYMPRKVSEARKFCPATVLPFTDDFAGGYHVFPIEDGRAVERVCYWNTDGGLQETAFSDVFEYLATFAYPAA